MAKRSARYWEMRRARQMHAELVPVEEAADELTEIYLKASKDLEEQAAKLVDTFATNNKLSQAEARRMLDRVMDPSDIRQVIQELSLDPKNADLVAELESQAYGARLRRLQEAQAAADEAAAKILTRSGTIFDKTLAGVIRKTHADQIFDLHKRTGFAFPYTPVSDQRIEQILRTPWHGANYSQNLWGNTQDLAIRVKQEMVESLLTGKSNERMRQGIQEQFGAKASDARRLIRTEAVLGYRTVLWSFAYSDYSTDSQPSYEEGIEAVKRGLHPGCVYLLHAESATNAAILAEFIDWVRSQAYDIVPLCDIKA